MGFDVKRDATELGKRIRELRAGTTQQVFAKKLGIPYQNLGEYERGVTQPGAKNLLNIAAVTGCNLNWLLAGQGDPYIADVSVAGEDRTEELREKLLYYQGCRPIPLLAEIRSKKGGNLTLKRFRNKMTEPGPAVTYLVKDDSLEPLAKPGQRIITVLEKLIRDGHPALLFIERKGIFFKRPLRKGRGVLELQSINPLRPEPSMIVPETAITHYYRIIGVLFE